MNWKLKAAVQRGCAALPWGGEDVYYLLQRGFGDVQRNPYPLAMLEECARLVGRMGEAGVRLEGARILEVGTGRRLDMPIGFYLAGAASTITFDLHRYLKADLVMGALAEIRRNREQVRGYFAPVAEMSALGRRLDSVCAVREFADLMELTRIEYEAPGDAAVTGLPPGSIDIHTSYTVFEHIPGPVLQAILMEANRILAPGGVAVHHIDPSDHFSHADNTIPPINFLQFSAKQWDKYAGNQFAYHNRLRPDDFADIYRECGHDILQWTPKVDERSRKLIEDGFPLDREFRGAALDALCTTVLHVLSRPRQ